MIIRAVQMAAKEAKLCYGRKTPNGFTLHCLRHSFITEVLARTNDIATTMRYSGHKTLAAFSVYLHETEFGNRKALQVIENIDGFLTGSLRSGRSQNVENASELAAKPLPQKKIANLLGSLR